MGTNGWQRQFHSSHRSAGGVTLRTADTLVTLRWRGGTSFVTYSSFLSGACSDNEDAYEAWRNWEPRTPLRSNLFRTFEKSTAYASVRNDPKATRAHQPPGRFSVIFRKEKLHERSVPKR
jgi:hypothetical protein